MCTIDPLCARDHEPLIDWSKEPVLPTFPHTIRCELCSQIVAAGERIAHHYVRLPHGLSQCAGSGVLADYILPIGRAIAKVGEGLLEACDRLMLAYVERHRIRSRHCIHVPSHCRCRVCREG